MAKALPLMIKQVVRDKELKALRTSRSYPLVLHLFFTDETMFFVEASDRNIVKLKDVIELYCHATGQAINIQKSLIMLSKNTTPTMRSLVKSIMGI